MGNKKFNKSYTVNMIGEGKCKFLAHLIPRNKILAKILMDKVEGTRTRRQRIMWLQSKKDWTGMTLQKMMIAAGSGKIEKKMSANYKL